MVNNTKKFLIISIFCISLIFFLNLFIGNVKAACSDACKALNPPTNYTQMYCCPGGDPNNNCLGATGFPSGVGIPVGNNHSCSTWPYTGLFGQQQPLCWTCGDGSTKCTDKYCINSVANDGIVNCNTCDPSHQCIDTAINLGDCSDGGGEAGACGIRNLSCPATCAVGQNFNLSYEFRNLVTKPKTSHRIEGSIASGFKSLFCNPYDYRPNDFWQTESRSVACTADLTGSIRVGAHVGTVDWMDWCSYVWSDAMIDCNASCNITVLTPPPLPPAIGYVKIKHPLGILKLRLISFIDAKLARKGILKVARFNGDTNASADLVETNDPNASPVRVKTPFGIKAWRMTP